ncbi:MAG: DUF411 domain-containing protein [Candidatus Thiodiazotropha sp. (ex Lucinoma annulata)]|nr:DUF411 domain-containing protein [Candidatus Thiodiazotropha sp. (ex Lucinoma borealis)]MCU7868007.1 DUF411 domain-containing protein [Candidatus Thiodiazotropha sp. (ex Lucinoma borealis)]MCU7885683.1 DUF411 domain-containing protein [Candidatus Thiodiazotropha sp. (ex Lucinoma annulata)]
MTKIRLLKIQYKSTYTKLVSWVLASFLIVSQVNAADIVVYKSPTCGCCSAWIKHLQKNGFSVEMHDRKNMQLVKKSLGVPSHLQSCHTALVGDYIVEGHVPADDITRLLKEKPAVKGVTVPGMPMGSPGMEGPRKDKYDVLTFEKNGKTRVYSSY